VEAEAEAQVEAEVEAEAEAEEQAAEEGKSREAAPQEVSTLCGGPPGAASAASTTDTAAGFSGESMEPPLLLTDIDQLKSENNFLTEQLVEASMESAANFESFSNDRNALCQLAQDLRRRLHHEQAERARCSALLSAAQESLEKIAAENLQMAEGLMRYHSENPGLTSETSRSIDALWDVHRRETAQLRLAAEQRGQECEQLRLFVRQQTSQANSTILEITRRNVELEERLREARRLLEQHGLPGPVGADPPPAPEATPLLSGQLPLPRDAQGNGGGSRSHGGHAPSRTPPRLRRIASGPARLGASAAMHGTRAMAVAEPMAMAPAPNRYSAVEGSISEAAPCQGPRTPPNGRGHTARGLEDSKLGSALVSGTAPVGSQSPREANSQCGASAEGLQSRRGSPQASPLMGLDGRYMGRGVMPPAAHLRAGEQRRSDQLERSLDRLSAEMRRRHEEARFAAQ